MEKKLPDNWVETTLGDIAEWSSGGTPRRGVKEYYSGDIPWIKTGDLNDGIIHEASEYISEEGLNNSSAKLFPIGSVAIAMYGATIGKTGLFAINAATNQACGVAKPYFEMNVFIHYLLKSQKQAFIDKGKGGAQPNISQTVIKAHKIGLPPLLEQKRIVTKLDGLFAHLEEVKIRLEKVSQLLKDFRQAVLTKAVTGKLTKKKGSWERTTLGEVAIITMGQSPPGTSYNTTGDGVPLINGPVEFGGIDPFSRTKKVKYTTEPTKMCEENDLLICVRGSTTGRLNIAGFDACIGRGVASIQSTEVEQKYINIFMRLQYAKILSEGTGSTFPSISGSYIKSFVIDMPIDSTEQKKIVLHVETLFSKAEAIEEKYSTVKQKADKLPQAILAKAFRGELVEQFSYDGDANELLKEIQKLKSELKKKSK